MNGLNLSNLSQAYLILQFVLVLVGAILFIRGVIAIRRANSCSFAGTLSAWTHSFFETFLFVASFFISLLVLPALGVFIARQFYPDVNFSDFPIYVIGFYQPLAFIFLLFVCKLINLRLDADLELQDKHWYSFRNLKGVWAFFSLILFCALVTTFFSNLLPKLFPPLEAIWVKEQILVENLRELKDPSVLFFAIPTIVIFTPIVEEIFFRAGFYRILKAKLGIVPAIALSSFIFAILHDSTSGIIPLTCFACILCYAYERSGKIIVPILLHVLFNLNALLSILFGTA